MTVTSPVLPGVKTAISVPDEVFHRATRHAERLGMSRSEFFSTAARRWVEQLEGGELTAAIDIVLDQASDDAVDADDAAFLRRAAGRRIGVESDAGPGVDQADER